MSQSDHDKTEKTYVFRVKRWIDGTHSVYKQPKQYEAQYELVSLCCKGSIELVDKIDYPLDDKRWYIEYSEYVCKSCGSGL